MLPCITDNDLLSQATERSIFDLPRDSDPNALRIKSRHWYEEIMNHDYIIKGSLKQLQLKAAKDSRNRNV